jgi:hypothetical protein
MQMHHLERCYDVDMRTTITLESDVATLIREHMSIRGLSFRDAVNSLLRGALAPAPRDPERRFVIPTKAMGQPYFEMEKALAIAAELEDREIIRKLELGK